MKKIRQERERSPGCCRHFTRTSPGIPLRLMSLVCSIRGCLNITLTNMFYKISIDKEKVNTRQALP